jgi:hypothetical protein
VFSAFGFCLLAGIAALCTACGQGALEAPQVPARDIETRILPPKHERHEIPRLIAPPPAYGNKIVMAHAGAPSVTN